MKKILVFFFCLLSSAFSHAQEVDMADRLRSEGKIYVVVAVLVTILLGIIVYLVMIDRKVSDIEKKLKK